MDKLRQHTFKVHSPCANVLLSQPPGSVPGQPIDARPNQALEALLKSEVFSETGKVKALPDCLRCPINGGLLVDPVVGADGRTVENDTQDEQRVPNLPLRLYLQRVLAAGPDDNCSKDVENELRMWG